MKCDLCNKDMEELREYNLTHVRFVCFHCKRYVRKFKPLSNNEYNNYSVDTSNQQETIAASMIALI
jgi:hypothetical protein